MDTFGSDFMPLMSLNPNHRKADQKGDEPERKTKHSEKKKWRMMLQDIDASVQKGPAPTNPLDFIDVDTQKVAINPGVPYKSTSQNEVFERRFERNEAENLRK